MANTEEFLCTRHFLNALHILFHFISKTSLWSRFYNDSLCTDERLCHEHPAGGLTAGQCTAEVWLCIHFSSVAQSCPTLSNPMNHSTPGLPVHHQLPEFTKTHVHWVSDAIQPSHPLSSPFPTVLNLSQHQGLFKWVSPSHQVAKVSELQLQHLSFQWTPRTDLL